MVEYRGRKKEGHSSSAENLELLKVLSVEPGVNQNIALYASPIA